MSELDDRIRVYRDAGHQYAWLAEKMRSEEEDPAVVGCVASLATMYFAMALDARMFGDPPELPED